MTDREKKIAEIRERYGRRNENGQRFAIFQGHAADDIFFLLSELDREREENRKLREERDAAVEGYQQQVKYAGELMTKLVSVQQERNMYKSSSEVFYERLKKEAEQREKLIKCLRWYADTKNYEYRTSYLDQDAPIIDDSGQRARDILKGIGVTVE